MMEYAFINVKNRSSTITADVEIPQGSVNGLIVAQGGRFGGWSLYVKDGKPTYTYNWIGLQRYTVASESSLAPGKATIKLDFAYAGRGRGMGGVATLTVSVRHACLKIGPKEPADLVADPDVLPT